MACMIFLTLLSPAMSLHLKVADPIKLKNGSCDNVWKASWTDVTLDQEYLKSKSNM